MKELRFADYLAKSISSALEKAVIENLGNEKLMKKELLIISIIEENGWEWTLINFSKAEKTIEYIDRKVQESGIDLSEDLPEEEYKKNSMEFTNFLKKEIKEGRGFYDEYCPNYEKKVYERVENVV